MLKRSIKRRRHRHRRCCCESQFALERRSPAFVIPISFLFRHSTTPIHHRSALVERCNYVDDRRESIISVYPRRTKSASSRACRRRNTCPFRENRAEFTWDRLRLSFTEITSQISAMSFRRNGFLRTSPGKLERDLHNEGSITAPLNALRFSLSLSLCHGKRYNSTVPHVGTGHADYATKAPRMLENAIRRRWLYDRWHLPRPARRLCSGGARARLHRGVTAANIKVIDASIKQRAAARLRCPCDPGRFKVVFT